MTVSHLPMRDMAMLLDVESQSAGSDAGALQETRKSNEDQGK